MRKVIISLVLLSVFLFSSITSPAIGAYGGINMDTPVAAPVNAGYLYGEKYSSSSSSGHMGLDFAASSGTPIYSAYAGKITKIERLTTSYGYHVVIESDHPLYSGTKFYHVYAHMSYINDGVNGIKVNTWYPKGTYLGNVGATGNAIGAHLHFEIRMGAYDYYKQRNPEGLLNRSTSDGYGGVSGKVLQANGSWARYKRISGASRPTDTNYGASYTYHLMDNSAAFPDEQSYGINYYIARAKTGSVTLNYDNGNRTQTVNILSNTDFQASTINLTY